MAEQRKGLPTLLTELRVSRVFRGAIGTNLGLRLHIHFIYRQGAAGLLSSLKSVIAFEMILSSAKV